MTVKRIFLLLLIFFWSIHHILGQNENNFFQGIKTVVIDAGHGGKDHGCHGKFSNEKDVALSISLKLGKYLEEKFEHLEVIYTRKTDVFLELDERAKIANKHKADLFICIHANAGSSAAFGTETYVMGEAKKEANMRAAQRENASILLEEDYEQRYANFDPNSAESYIAMTLMQSAYLKQSTEFAKKVQQQFRDRVGRKDRGVKQAPFLVLHQTTMPSVLIETGFLTNANEEKFLNSEIGQDYLASAIFRAFREYKKEIDSKTASISNENLEEEEEVEEKKEPVVAKKEKKKAKEKTTPAYTHKEDEGIIFKVQLATSSTKIKTDAKNFKGLEGVNFYEAGGLFRYTYGYEKDWESASKLQEKVRESGFEDAFVIAFFNGKRIGVGEAVRLLKRDL